MSKGVKRMREKRTPIPVGECVGRVMQYAKNRKQEIIALEEAHGRFLAEDLIADHDIPAFDRSPYDGFAVRSQDTKEASSLHPVELAVRGEIGAGSVFEHTVSAMQAVRIMTGAPIPKGCDAVAMLEVTKEYTKDNQPIVQIKRSFNGGDNISFQGEETTKGTVLASKGTYITPGVAALLATFGYDNVAVFQKPVVGLLATGSELVEVSDPVERGKIRNSNAHMLRAQIEKAGGEVNYFGIMPDDLSECYNAVKSALSEVDMLITTGGVSVGDYDYLPDVYKQLQAEVLFNKIAMRPGSVTTVARMEEKLLFGLSGNPTACYVGFELLARPVISTYAGKSTPHLRKEKALLGKDFLKPNPFMRFVSGRLSYREGQLIASPLSFTKSSAVSSLAHADTLIIFPGGTRGYKEGMLVDVLLLDDVRGSEWPW